MFDWLTREITNDLLRGVWLTVALTIVTAISATIAGVAVGALRMSSRGVGRRLAGAYIEVFRNVPALIQIIFWAFAVPNLFNPATRKALLFDNAVMDVARDLTGIPIPYYGLAGALALTLNTSAYIAELFRAGASSIPTAQVDAVRTLGATRSTAFRTLVLPAGLRAAFPAMSTRLVHNMKNTALVSFVAVPELFHELQASIQSTFRATEFLLLGAVIYLVLAAALSALLGWVDRRLHRGRLRHQGHRPSPGTRERVAA